MVHKTHIGHLESEVVPIDGRSFQQVWPGGENAMVDFNIQDRTQPHSQPLQEVEVNNGQEVKSTCASGSVKEKSEAKIERRRDPPQQHNNAVNVKKALYGLKCLIAGFSGLLFLSVAYVIYDSVNTRWLSRTSEVKRAATRAESAIMDNARKKETNMTVHQRLRRRDWTMPEPKNVNMSKKVGDKVEYKFTCPSNDCKIHFRNQIGGRDVIICSGEECDPGYKIDDKGVLVFNASIETAGEYRLKDFDRNATVDSFRLSIENAADPFKSGATFSKLSFSLLIAIHMLVYCIGQV